LRAGDGEVRPPRLLSGARRRAAQMRANEILALARAGVLKPDPVLKLICAEFEACPRADWAETVRQYHEAHDVGGLAGQKGFRLLVESAPDAPQGTGDGGAKEEIEADVAALTRPVPGHEIDILLGPYDEQEFVWDPARDICWRWRGVWRLLVRLTLKNLSGDGWGTAGKWDVRRVNLDEIAGNERLGWYPVPQFTSWPPGPRTYHCRLEIIGRPRA